MTAPEVQPKRPLAEDLRDLLRSPRELWIAYAIWFVESAGVFSMIYTLVLWLSVDFGYDDRGAANWAAAFSSCATLFMLAAGFVGDTLGIRRGLIIAFGILTAGRFLMGFASGRAMAITGMMVMCVGYAGVLPLMNTAFRRFSHPRARTFAFSIFYVMNNLGGAAGGFLVDAFRQRFFSPHRDKLVPKVFDIPGVGPHAFTAYRSIYLAGAAFAVVGFVLTLLLRSDVDTERPSDVPRKVGQKSIESPWHIAADVMRAPSFWRFMLLMALLVFVKMIYQHGYFTLPKYALRELGERFPIGRIQTINPIAITFLVPLVTVLTRRMTVFRVILLGSFISAGSVFVLLLPASTSTIVSFYLLLSVGEALWAPRSYEYAATIAPLGRESSYMGLSQLPFFVAKLGALPLSGWLLSQYCPPEGPRRSYVMWLVIGLTTAVAPFAMLALRSVIEGEQSRGRTST